MTDSKIIAIEQPQKNKMMQTVTNIKELHPRDRNKIIEAKVYRSWIARDPPDTTEKGCRAILLDREVSSK